MPRKHKISQKLKQYLNQDVSIHRDKLRALRTRRYYKDDASYIKAVYRANKKYIDANMRLGLVDLHGTPERAFYYLVKADKMEDTNPKTKKKYTVDEAINSVANSYEMNPTWEASDIYANNFKKLLKTHPEEYKQLRMTEFREGNKFAKFDPNKLQYKGFYIVDGTRSAVYYYGDTVIIEAESPTKNEGANLKLWSKDQFNYAMGNTVFEAPKRARRK